MFPCSPHVASQPSYPQVTDNHKKSINLKKEKKNIISLNPAISVLVTVNWKNGMIFRSKAPNHGWNVDQRFHLALLLKLHIFVWGVTLGGCLCHHESTSTTPGFLSCLSVPSTLLLKTSEEALLIINIKLSCLQMLSYSICYEQNFLYILNRNAASYKGRKKQNHKSDCPKSWADREAPWTAGLSREHYSGVKNIKAF